MDFPSQRALPSGDLFHCQGGCVLQRLEKLVAYDELLKMLKRAAALTVEQIAAGKSAWAREIHRRPFQ